MTGIHISSHHLTPRRDLRLLLLCMLASACLTIGGLLGLAMWIHG